jgi:hypothetical protein
MEDLPLPIVPDKQMQFIPAVVPVLHVPILTQDTLKAISVPTAADHVVAQPTSYHPVTRNILTETAMSTPASKPFIK